MAKEEAIEVEGRVKEALANTQFRVELDIGGERDPREPLHRVALVAQALEAVAEIREVRSDIEQRAPAGK